MKFKLLFFLSTISFIFSSSFIHAQTYCPTPSQTTDTNCTRPYWDENNPSQIAPGGSVSLRVRNGCLPYAWTVQGEGFGLGGNGETTSPTNTLSLDAVPVDCVANITVTDRKGRTVIGSVTASTCAVCTVTGPDGLSHGESATYVDSYGNQATVTMPQGAAGSVSLSSLGAANLDCDRMIRCLSSGQWKLVHWCSERAWDNIFVSSKNSGIYRWVEDWCTRPCSKNCLGECPAHTPRAASCYVESSKLYMWVE